MEGRDAHTRKNDDEAEGKEEFMRRLKHTRDETNIAFFGRRRECCFFFPSGCARRRGNDPSTPEVRVVFFQKEACRRRNDREKGKRFFLLTVKLNVRMLYLKTFVLASP